VLQENFSELGKVTLVNQGDARLSHLNFVVSICYYDLINASANYSGDLGDYSAPIILRINHYF
jgi:hypothetical protein